MGYLRSSRHGAGLGSIGALKVVGGTLWLSAVLLKRGLVARLGFFHCRGPLTSNFEDFVGRPMRETVMATILPVSASARIANHPVLPVPPIPTLLILRHVDAKEVSEAVVALALVKVGVELGTLGR